MNKEKKNLTNVTLSNRFLCCSTISTHRCRVWYSLRLTRRTSHLTVMMASLRVVGVCRGVSRGRRCSLCNAGSVRLEALEQRSKDEASAESSTTYARGAQRMRTGKTNTLGHDAGFNHQNQSSLASKRGEARASEQKRCQSTCAHYYCHTSAYRGQ